MVELAPVGLPPPEQGNLCLDYLFVHFLLFLWRKIFTKYFEIHFHYSKQQNLSRQAVFFVMTAHIIYLLLHVLFQDYILLLQEATRLSSLALCLS